MRRIPQASEILKLELVLTSKPVKAFEGRFLVDIHRVKGDVWEEGSVVWDNSPKLREKLASYEFNGSAVSTNYQRHVIDITHQLMDKRHVDIALKVNKKSSALINKMNFVSREADAQYAPKLRLVLVDDEGVKRKMTIAVEQDATVFAGDSEARFGQSKGISLSGDITSQQDGFVRFSWPASLTDDIDIKNIMLEVMSPGGLNDLTFYWLNEDYVSWSEDSMTWNDRLLLDEALFTYAGRIEGELESNQSHMVQLSRPENVVAGESVSLLIKSETLALNKGLYSREMLDREIEGAGYHAVVPTLHVYYDGIVNYPPTFQARTFGPVEPAYVGMNYEVDISGYASDVEGDALFFCMESEGDSWISLTEAGVLYGVAQTSDLNDRRWDISVGDKPCDQADASRDIATVNVNMLSDPAD